MSIQYSKQLILDNIALTKDIYKMSIEGNYQAKPGQFINIKVENSYLRRPISISNIEDNQIDIIYKVVGVGTKQMTELKKGDYVDILVPLGNGFSLVENKKVLLIGGGIGTPPLLELKKQLEESNEVQLLVGLNTSEEDVYEEYQPIIATIDGSKGFKGNVIDYLKNNDLTYDYVYICGPIAMIRALEDYLDVSGEISIEARMGCGFGACMGCSCQTKTGKSKRVCVEGPVFKLGELNFDEN